MRGEDRREPTWSADRRDAPIPTPKPAPMGRFSADAQSVSMRSAESPRGRAGDRTTRILAASTAGLAGLMVAGVAAWSLLGRHHGGIPVLSPPPGPVRVRPLDPGGMQLTALPAIGGDSGGPPTLAPGPEQPHPQALQAEVDAARRSEAPPAPTAAPVAAQPVATPPITAPPVTAPPVTAPPVSTPPGPTPATAPAAAPIPAPAPDAAGGSAVQLGALPSVQAAQTEWHRLSVKVPALLAGRQPSIERVTRGDQVFYRLRTGGFASIAQASEFCVQVRAAGGACALAGF